jgi:hypothetical protein
MLRSGLKPGKSERISLVRVNDYSSSLEFDDAAPEANHRGMGSIVGAEL